jgi:adenylate cyclase, class 2
MLDLGMEPACNIELKARVADLGATREIARRLATSCLGVQEQTDTYFHCPQGRLKLREIVDLGNRSPAADGSLVKRMLTQLISYDREDDADAKESHYQLVDIRDPARVRELKSQMGTRAVVFKRREVFLYHNVRIHLDEVTDLGTFLEFEAVLGGDVDVADGRAQVALLRHKFGIVEDDLVEGSYVDLLLEKVDRARLVPVPVD